MWGTVDIEIKVSLTETPVLSEGPFFTPGVGQCTKMQLCLFHQSYKTFSKCAIKKKSNHLTWLFMLCPLPGILSAKFLFHFCADYCFHISPQDVWKCMYHEQWIRLKLGIWQHFSFLTLPSRVTGHEISSKQCDLHSWFDIKCQVYSFCRVCIV